MLNSDRGRIQPPNLDDRTWQELVDEAVALIPRYAPQWTDYSPGDLGRTLIELFAWLVEGLTYRLNRVPEKNYIAFLNLLGITREPAVPAHVFLTFIAQPPATGQPAAPVRVLKRTQVQTQGTETQAHIVFETDANIDILPTNLKTVLYIPSDPSDPAAGKYQNFTTALAAPPANGHTITVPGASQAQAAQPVQLFLGFDTQVTTPLPLNFRLFKPVGTFPDPKGTSTPPTRIPQAAISKFTYSTAAATDPAAWPQISNVVDTTNGLQQEGTVTITPPLDWAKQAPTNANQQPPQWAAPAASPADQVTDAFFWIGITIVNKIPVPVPPATAAPWVQIGISSILCNAVSAYNALTILVPETLGQSDGTPFQVFQLQHYPLFKRPNTDTPYDHLEVQVDGITWMQVDDFPAGPGNVYRLNPVTGEIGFGNFDPAKNQQGHGSIPRNGAQIKALTYRYVAGGLTGNVGAGKINVLVSHLDGIVGVINNVSSFDAADEEPIDDTLRRAPELLRSRDRAITVEDYEVLAREATSEVVLVRCLEPRIQDITNVSSPPAQPGQPWMFGSLDRSPGNVNVIIVPDRGSDVPRPQPSKELLQKVQAYLDARRDLTARLFVTVPRYLPIKVTVTISIWQRVLSANPSLQGTLKNDTLDKINAFLHPIHGGPNGAGWQIGQSIFVTDLFKALMPSPDIGYISSLAVQADTPVYHFPPLGPGGEYNKQERPFPFLPAGPSVRLADYELVCSILATDPDTPSHSVNVTGEV